MLSENGRIRLSASDLMRFMSCTHASHLDLERLHGCGPEPARDSEDAALLQRHGDAHEAEHLETLRAGGDVIEIERDQPFSQAVAATVTALRQGPARGQPDPHRWTVISDTMRKPLTDCLDDDLSVEGHIEPGDTSEDVEQAGFGAHFVEVAVNATTGETRVRRMLGCFAAGRILNEQTARSQCQGGMIHGIGAALTEDLVHDPRDGHIVNHNLAEYHVPVNLDVPQIDVMFLEERDAYANPLQSKGIGELGISGAGAAITNAIFNATGVRVRDYPATLDKVFGGLDPN